MTAREQLLIAREKGHELSITTRVRDDFPDAAPKYWVNCTCGYVSRARRSKPAVNSTMIMHLAKAVADDQPRSAS